MREGQHDDARELTRREVTISGRAPVRAELVVPVGAVAAIVVACAGEGAPRVRAMADAARRLAPVATIAVDLAVAGESASDDGELAGHLVPVLAERAGGAVDLACEDLTARYLPLALVGLGAAGAAVLLASTMRRDVRAVVSVDGRPDLAGEALEALRAPTLLVVDERDDAGIARNRSARARVRGRSDLAVLPAGPGARESAQGDERVVMRLWSWLETVMR